MTRGKDGWKITLDTSFEFVKLADDPSRASYKEWLDEKIEAQRAKAKLEKPDEVDQWDDPKEQKRLARLYQARAENIRWETCFYNDQNDTEIVDLEVDWDTKTLSFNWKKTISNLLYEAQECSRRKKAFVSIVPRRNVSMLIKPDSLKKTRCSNVP